MKYLSDYTDKKTSAVFGKYGAFFAFSQKQLDEKKKDDVEYASLGGGLIAPIGCSENLRKDLNCAYQEGITDDIAENGIKKIIHRELGNHECQITMNYDEVIDKLEPYGITAQQVVDEWSEYFDNCVANDYF